MEATERLKRQGLRKGGGVCLKKRNEQRRYRKEFVMAKNGLDKWFARSG